MACSGHGHTNHVACQSRTPDSIVAPCQVGFIARANEPTAAGGPANAQGIVGVLWGYVPGQDGEPGAHSMQAM